MREDGNSRFVEVGFVRSGAGARAAIQEWRSEATGRIHEVQEARAYAPGAILEPGAKGWLIYAGGAPVVGETPDEARRMARRVGDRRVPAPVRPPRERQRHPPLPWPAIFALVLLAAVIWAALL